jgi:hypothetical protein
MQSESQWARGSAATHLHGIGSLDKEAAIDVLLEIAAQGDKNMRLKLSGGYKAAKLGAVEQGAQILREVIAAPHAGEAVKDAAFDALREIVESDTVHDAAIFYVEEG